MKRNPATLRETNFEATVTRFEFSGKFSRKSKRSGGESKDRFYEAGDSPRSGFGHVSGTQGVLLCRIRKSTCICKKFRSRIPGFASWKCFWPRFRHPKGIRCAASQIPESIDNCLGLAIAPLAIPTIFSRFVERAERVDALAARGAR